MILAKIKQNILPILFSSVLSVSILNMFTESIVFVSVMTTLYCASVFLFCDFLRNKSRRISLYYILSMLILIVLSLSVLWSSPGDRAPFYSWLISLYSEEFITAYFVVLFSLVGFFVTSAVYYFTVIKYRKAILFLLIAIPGMINISKYREMHTVFIILLVLLYFVILITYSRDSGANTAVGRFNASFAFSGAAFASVILIIALIVPKPEISLIRDTLSNAFKSNNITSYAGFHSKSGGRPNYTQSSNVVLFEVDAPQPVMLRRDAYFLYDGSNFTASSNSVWDSGGSNWEEDAGNLDYMLLYRAIKKHLNSGYSSALTANDIPEVTDEIQYADIYHKDFSTAYFLNTLRTKKVSTGSRDKIFSDKNRILFLPGGKTGKTAEYTISYGRELIRENKDIKNFIEKLDEIDYGRLLENARYDNAILTDSERRAVNAFYDEYKLAQEYKEYTLSESVIIPKAIRELAEEVTAECVGDYEKAVALERYFTDAGFDYSLSYIPPSGKEGNVSYFLFNSQKGTCSDYAAAMTLMARSVGMCARYTEGFVCKNKNDTGFYEITPRNAHAFVEIYINGYGYATFDPTVASSVNFYDSQSGTASSGSSGSSWDIAVAVTTAAAAGLLIIFRFVLLPVIKEWRFRRKLIKSGNSDCVYMVYLKLLSMLETALSADCRQMTPDILIRYVRFALDVDISEFVLIYRNAFFNENESTSEQKQYSIKLYKDFCKTLRKRNKHRQGSSAY